MTPTASMILNSQDIITKLKTLKMGQSQAVDSHTGEISSYRIMFAEQSHICYPTHSCTGTCLVIPLFSFSTSQYSFTHLFCFSRTIYSRPVKRPLVQDIHPQQPRSMQTFVNYLSISSNPFYFGVSSSFSGFQLFLTVSRR